MRTAVGEDQAVLAGDSPPTVKLAESPARENDNLFALAESATRWEDDVSAAEVAHAISLYRRFIESARGAVARAHPDEDARTELLRLRYQARRIHAASAHRRQPRAFVRALLTLLGLALLMAGVEHGPIVDKLDLGNVSQGKPWTSSSTYSLDVPTHGVLGDFTRNFFFHTAVERDPWIEIDLGKNTRVRRATIVNRDDCCGLRSLPLIVEASRDHRTWTEAARRDQEFDVWRPTLSVGAVRWVRFRVPRTICFHLKAIVLRS